MSINLHLLAMVKATLHTDPPSETTLKHFFVLWQTPSKVSHEAIHSDNPKQVYVNWLKEVEPKDTESVGVFAEDDEFGENGIVGYVDEPTSRVIHEQNLEKWLTEHKGWNLIWEAY